MNTGERCLTFGGVYQKTQGVCIVPNLLVGNGSVSSSVCECPDGFTAQEIDTEVPAGNTVLGFCGRTDGTDGLWGGVYLLNKSVADGCYESNPLAANKCTCMPGDSADYSVSEGLLMKATGSGWNGFLGLSTCYPGDTDAFKALSPWETFHGMFLTFNTTAGTPSCASGNPLLSLDKPVCDCLPGDKKVTLKVLTQGDGGNALGDLVVCLNDKGG